LLQAELLHTVIHLTVLPIQRSFTDVSAGTDYHIASTDAKSCGPVTGTVDVNQPPVLALTSAAVTTAINCNGGKATVTIVATGGTAHTVIHLIVLLIQREFYRRICRNWTIIWLTDAKSCGPVTGTLM
jgi:hypothetical protein